MLERRSTECPLQITYFYRKLALFSSRAQEGRTSAYELIAVPARCGCCVGFIDPDVTRPTVMEKIGMEDRE